MPIYEMPILIQLLNKSGLMVTLKRTAELIFDKGGFIRKIDNLGKLNTPYKMSKGIKSANYFIFHFNIPPVKLSHLSDELTRDSNIIRWRIYNASEDAEVECTLEEALLPPPYRPEVQKLIESGKKYRTKKDRMKFKFNTGLTYYPFQR